MAYGVDWISKRPANIHRTVDRLVLGPCCIHRSIYDGVFSSPTPQFASRSLASKWWDGANKNSFLYQTWTKVAPKVYDQSEVALVRACVPATTYNNLFKCDINSSCIQILIDIVISPVHLSMHLLWILGSESKRRCCRVYRERVLHNNVVRKPNCPSIFIPSERFYIAEQRSRSRCRHNIVSVRHRFAIQFSFFLSFLLHSCRHAVV